MLRAAVRGVAAASARRCRRRSVVIGRSSHVPARRGRRGSAWSCSARQRLGTAWPARSRHGRSALVIAMHGAAGTAIPRNSWLGMAARGRFCFADHVALVSANHGAAGGARHGSIRQGHAMPARHVLSRQRRSASARDSAMQALRRCAKRGGASRGSAGSPTPGIARLGYAARNLAVRGRRISACSVPAWRGDARLVWLVGARLADAWRRVAGEAMRGFALLGAAQLGVVRRCRRGWTMRGPAIRGVRCWARLRAAVLARHRKVWRCWSRHGGVALGKAGGSRSARPGTALQAYAGHGIREAGKATQRNRLAWHRAAVDADQCPPARGSARHGWAGEAMRGWFWLGFAWRVDAGWSKLCSSPHGYARNGSARPAVRSLSDLGAERHRRCKAMPAKQVVPLQRMCWRCCARPALRCRSWQRAAMCGSARPAMPGVARSVRHRQSETKPAVLCLARPGATRSCSARPARFVHARRCNATARLGEAGIARRGSSPRCPSVLVEAGDALLCNAHQRPWRDLARLAWFVPAQTVGAARDLARQRRHVSRSDGRPKRGGSWPARRGTASLCAACPGHAGNGMALPVKAGGASRRSAWRGLFGMAGTAWLGHDWRCTAWQSEAGYARPRSSGQCVARHRIARPVVHRRSEHRRCAATCACRSSARLGRRGFAASAWQCSALAWLGTAWPAVLGRSSRPRRGRSWPASLGPAARRWARPGLACHGRLERGNAIPVGADPGKARPARGCVLWRGYSVQSRQRAACP